MFIYDRIFINYNEFTAESEKLVLDWKQWANI